jgi:hypothetical protein
MNTVTLIVGLLALAFLVQAFRMAYRADEALAREAKALLRASKAEAARDLALERADAWKARAREHRDELLQERPRYDLLLLEHKALLLSLAPEYIATRYTGSSEPAVSTDVETPTVAEADRLEMEDRRRRETQERIRSESMQPVVIADDEVQPPHRVDATAYDHDDDEDDGR